MSFSKMICRILLFAVCMTPISAWCAHPLLTDDTGTQGTGKFQVEATGTWTVDQEDAGGEGVREINSLASLAFAAGVAETLDLMVGVPYVWTETKEAGQITKIDGVSDAVIEAKWRFYEKEKLSLAFKPGVLIPTGSDSKGLGTGHFGATAFLLSTFEGGHWAFDANLGYLHLENRISERVNLWYASVSSRFKATERWAIVGEIGATRNSDPACSSHPAFAQAGVIFSPSELLDLSAGYLAGLTDTEADQSVRAGITVRF